MQHIACTLNARDSLVGIACNGVRSGYQHESGRLSTTHGGGSNADGSGGGVGGGSSTGGGGGGGGNVP